MLEDEVMVDDPLIIHSCADAEDVIYLGEGDEPLDRFVKILKMTWQSFNSEVLIPDAFKGHPYTRPFILAGLILFLVLPIKLYVIMVVFGFVLAMFLLVPVDQDGGKHAFIKHKFEQIDQQITFPSDLEPEKRPMTLHITPKINAALDVMLDRLVTSLVDSWYMQINKSGQREFQSCVRTIIDAFVMNLKGTVHGLGKDSLTLYVYGLTNALNVHMQEFKSFAKSGLETAKEFLVSSASRRSYFPSTEAEANHFRQIVAILLKKLLPRQESKSIIVISLVKELLASGALWNAMDRLCDPDFINMKIVEALSEPSDLPSQVEPGWSLVIVKILKGEELPMEADEGGMYCIIHIAGRKVKTRRINDLIWNETFQFKVSDQILPHLQVHVQLCRYSYVGQDTSFGYAKLAPPPHGNAAKQEWLSFKKGKLFVESFTLTSVKAGLVVEEQATSTPKSINSIGLDGILKDNELFMEFYEFMNEFKAPPYLQFFMNYEAFRQFTAIELGVDPSMPEAINNYFKYHSLTDAQLEQLKMIKHDARDLFNTHFSPDAKYPIDLNEAILGRLKEDLSQSDKTDESKKYVGTGPIGPNMFIPVYQWIYGVLNDVYFEKFKASPKYQERSIEPSKFAFDDDATTVFSAAESKSMKLDMEQEDFVEGIGCDDAEMDVKKISTTISILKQQLAVIEDKLEVVPSGSSDQVKLKKSKKEIEGQVKSLMNLVRSKDSGSSQDLWLDLRNVEVRVSVPMSDNVSSSSLWSSEPIFNVEVVKRGVEETIVLSVVSKAYSDFETLNRKLRKEFPKLEKVSFPQSASEAHLLEGLQLYMTLVTSDEFVRQSALLRQFVSLDGDLEGRSLSGLVESVVGKKVKNALQTATSILSAGMIGGGGGGGGGGSPSKKQKSHFYQTRDYHTTTDIKTSGMATPMMDSLHRSRSTTSLRDEVIKHEVLSSNAAKTVPPTPIKTPRMAEVSSDSPAIFQIEEFTEAEIDMLMETVYTFITETFDLREPNQWIRRKVLSVSKQFLKQAYGDTMAQLITETLNNGLKEDAWLRYIDGLTRLLWPNGIFIKDIPPPIRTPEQQLATQIEARTLFLNRIPDNIERLTGRYNAINGMTRIFSMLQHKDFNKLLFMTVIDITVKILVTEPVK